MSAQIERSLMTHAGVAVDLYWHDRVWHTFSFPRSGAITLGATADCDIFLDVLPQDFQTKTIAFVDELGGFHSMENDICLPLNLKVKCRPLGHRKPPQDGEVVALTTSEKTSLALSILLSLFLWLTIQKAPQLVQLENKIPYKTRIVFKKPILKPEIIIPEQLDSSPIEHVRNNHSPRVAKPISVSQMLKNIMGGTQGANSADLIEHAQKFTGAQTFAKGPNDQWSKGPTGGESLGSGDRKTVDLPGGSGVKPGRTMPSVSGLTGKVSVAIGGETGGGMEVTGKIDRNAIREVIQRNRNILQACYERHLARDSDLYGRILLQWDIVANGQVRAAKTVENSMQNKGVAECILTQLKTWQFPEPPEGQAARVTYPFVFSSQ